MIINVRNHGLRVRKVMHLLLSHMMMSRRVKSRPIMESLAVDSIVTVVVHLEVERLVVEPDLIGVLHVLLYDFVVL